ncbi:MAG: type II toxin-antitoxin system HicB family antitoxin [Ktedonobacteraceae bacterium]
MNTPLPKLKHSMVIEWSEEDQAYLVILPEWADRVMMPVTHGNTYSEAVKYGEEVLALLVRDTLREGKPLPPPKTHIAA